MGNAAEGKQVLRRALAGRACLVVVDDVWKQGHAQAFDVCGPEGMLLVTSRFDNVVSTPKEACIKVDVLEPPDGEVALAMLRSHAREEGGECGGVAESKGQADEDGKEMVAMRAVLRRCGGVPLAIALAGSLKRSLGEAWGEVLEAMEEQGGELLIRDKPSGDEDYRYEGLWAALRASVTHLRATSGDEHDCLLWYGVFMEDVWVPLEIVRRVWGMNRIRAKQVLRSLAGRSLIELDEGNEGRWRSQAHDLLRDFLRREALSQERLQGLHGAIVWHGMQACEVATVGASLDLRPYFGSEGVARHLDGSGQAKVGQMISIFVRVVFLMTWCSM
jgi:hypothetical protein